MSANAYWIHGQPDLAHHGLAPDASSPVNHVLPNPRPDHFVQRDGEVFAGTHLILDFHGAKSLDDLQHMECSLRAAVGASGATLLHLHLHYFTPNGGISGVAVLAESHISVHTWPECDYAAFDIFMCGNAQPELGARVLEEAFSPSHMKVITHRRGHVNGAP